MAIKAILFDLDGTLVDSNDLHVDAWDQAFRRHGLRIERQAIHDQIGKGADHLIPALAPQADEAVRARLDADQGAIFRTEHLARVQPFPHARELLQRVHGTGRKVVLASSASRVEVDAYLDRLEVRDLVAATTSADDVQASKPSPDIFATALRKVAPVQPIEALVVGDTPYDVQAGRRCGVATVAVRSGGFPDAALAGAGAIALYDDVAALLRDFDGSPLAC